MVLKLKSEFSDRMFQDLAEKLYSLVVQKRHYGFYINNLKLYNIPNPVRMFSYPHGNQLEGGPPATVHIKDDPVVGGGAAAVVNAAAAPAPGQPTQPATNVPEAERYCDIRYYNELISSVPSEYVSPSLVLHCLVEQVK